MIPWPRYRQIAFGILGWTPITFAQSTVRDLVDAMDGWLERHGQSPKLGVDVDELAMLKARYPDQPAR